MLALGASSAVLPLLGALPLALAATRQDLRFRALWHGLPVEHRVAFRRDGDRLTVRTQIDITVRVLFFTAFRLKHDAQEVWRSGRLLSLTSTTERDGTRLEVAGDAVEDGFLIVGAEGPFLATGSLLTSNSLWNSRIVRESRPIDVQYGGEVGLVARFLAHEQVSTPQGSVRASRYQMITPYYAGSIGHMLGVRRAGITEAARKLLAAGVIEYRRGHIAVPDRAMLEACACECYAVIRKEINRLQHPYGAGASRRTHLTHPGKLAA